MNDNTFELAENKLLLLHIIKSIKYPISNTQLTDIVLENSFINYFMLQQYVSELINSDFLRYEDKDSKEVILLTKKGDRVLTLFKDRISSNKLKFIDNCVNNKRESIKKEFSISSDYTIDNNNSFLVNLKAKENDFLIIDFTISVPSKEEAKFLCNKWKENSSEIYNKIITALINS